MGLRNVGCLNPARFEAGGSIYNRLVTFPPPEIPLREARPRDFAELWALDRRCFVPEIAYTRAELHKVMQEPEAFTLVAQRASGPILAFLVGALDARRRGHVITIDVLPDSRRCGLGGRLIRAAEERWRNVGVREVRLEVAVNNHAALAFYARFGYRILNRLPDYYPGGLDGLLLEKPLLPSRDRAST